MILFGRCSAKKADRLCRTQTRLVKVKKCSMCFGLALHFDKYVGTAEITLAAVLCM